MVKRGPSPFAAFGININLIAHKYGPNSIILLIQRSYSLLCEVLSTFTDLLWTIDYTCVFNAFEYPGKFPFHISGTSCLSPKISSHVESEGIAHGMFAR